MTTFDKDRFDAIAKLHERAWLQFNARRQYEFRVTLAFWTALAAGIVGTLRLASPPAIPGGRWAVASFALLAVLLHAIWTYGIWRGHGVDQAIAIHYQTLMQEMSASDFTDKVSAAATKSTKQMGTLLHPAAFAQIGLTFLLAAALVAVNWR